MKLALGSTFARVGHRDVQQRFYSRVRQDQTCIHSFKDAALMRPVGAANILS